MGSKTTANLEIFKKIIVGILLLGVLLLLVGSFVYLARNDLTSREGILLGFLQTIFSLVLSWVLSHLYAKYNFQNNLTTYALKAAEKVDNLSNELRKLGGYLQSEYDSVGEDPEKDLFSKRERIESAIYIIYTLKSINDRSLSDWHGVIPEIIEERREEEEEKRENLEEIYKEFVSIAEALKSTQNTEVPQPTEFTELAGQVASLKDQIRFMTREVLGVASTSTKPKKVDVTNPCPVCSTILNYKQKENINSKPILTCSSCQSRVLATWNPETGFKLQQNSEVTELIKCNRCKTEKFVDLRIFPGSATSAVCDKCGISLVITRGALDKEVRVSGGVEAIIEPPVPQALPTEDVINLIKNALPTQPWPSGTSHLVAERLHLPYPLVRRVIDELMDRGDFLFQRDGKLYKQLED